MVEKRRAAAMLREIAAMLELDGANQFKVRAYQEAADAVECMDGSLADAVNTGSIGEIKGVGKTLRAELETLIHTGSIPAYDVLAAKYPATVLEMLRIPGLGPKKVKAVLEDLGATSVDQLEDAGRLGRLAGIKGFGAKTQDKILRNIGFYRANKGKHLYARVAPVAADIRAQVCQNPAVVRCEIAGSLRRKREVVKDIDMVVSSGRPEDVMDAFVALPEVVEIVGKGPTKASVRLDGGIGMDLRVVSDEQFPYALLHFTGSAEHNTLLRGRAKTMGLKLNEYGLFREADDGLVPCGTEDDIYAALGLAWLPPELREGTGWEIAAAEARAVPALVSGDEIRGVFHNHTTDSDGRAGLDQMIEAAQRLGLQYIGISDHSRVAGYAHGLDDARLKAQHARIDAINRKLSGTGFRVLKGIEADILKDGNVDMEPQTLAGCDFVIASIHSRHGESREEMTQRICRAMLNPFVTMLGHISGRLLLERESYELDYERIFTVAAENGVIIEINGNPDRLELDWRYLQRAKAMGVRFCINPDAHSTDAISHVYFGVNVARKGGLEAGDILNTRTPDGVLEYLAGRKKLVLAKLG